MTIVCQLCKRRVESDFLSKWKHAFKYHPDVALKNSFPFLLDSAKCQNLGAAFANELKRRLQ